MIYALNLAEDGRILSVTYAKYAPANAVLVDYLPEGNTFDYICKITFQGEEEDATRQIEYVYNPLPEPPKPTPKETTDDVLNALLGVSV